MELGAAASPLSPARCAAAGSRGGLCSGGAGQDPSHRRVPALPELGTVGVGTGDQRSVGGRLGAWDFLSALLFVMELLSFGEGAGLCGRRESGKGAPALSPQQGRAQLSGPAPADLYCVHGWVGACIYA